MVAILRRMEHAANCLPGVRWRFWMVCRTPLARLSGAAEPPEGFELAEIGPSQLGSLRELSGARPSSLKSRFATGNRCLIARQDGHTVFCSWILGNRLRQALVARDHAQMHVDLRLGPGVCYCWDVFTHPKHRGRGVFGVAFTELARNLSAQGFHTLTALVSVGNSASLRAFEKAGFSMEVVLTHVEVFGRTVWADRYDAEDAKG